MLQPLSCELHSRNTLFLFTFLSTAGNTTHISAMGREEKFVTNFSFISLSSIINHPITTTKQRMEEMIAEI
jgi:hypothetical protein